MNLTKRKLPLVIQERIYPLPESNLTLDRIFRFRGVGMDYNVVFRMRHAQTKLPSM